MAYKEKMSNNMRNDIFQGELVHHFWAINKTVGWGCSNNYDDVLLVQYLINVWNKSKALEMDGIFGNKTYQAIKSFQKWANGYFAANALKNDGKVSAANGDAYNTKSGNHVYTIHILNYIYLQEKRIYYNDLRMDANLPSRLCNILSGVSI